MPRPRKLQRALDTIQLHGGLIGAAEAADVLNVEVSNLSWQKVEPWIRISNGRIPVYVRADVQARKDAKTRDRRAGGAE